VVSRAVEEAGAGPPPEGWRRFTAYVGYYPLAAGEEGGPGFESIEEIDLDAAPGAGPADRRRATEAILREGYEDGWTIVRIDERVGLYW
jgi:hypothetical protein